MSNFTKTPQATPQASPHNKAQKVLALRELCRRDLMEFAREFSTFEYKAGWLHRELCNVLMYAYEAAVQGKQPRIIIEAPPRVGKSQDVVRAFVAWLLGQQPRWEVAIATYNQELADDHGRDVRSVLTDPRYTTVFPDSQIDKTKRAVDQCAMVGSKGGFKAVGVGSALTGRGAHVLVVDDPIKDMEEARSETHTRKLFDWFQSVAMTRMAPEANLIVVMATRWSELDLTGRILDSELGKDYHVVSWPALAEEDEKHRKQGEPINPERFPSMEDAKKYYKKLQATLDPKIWNSLYQQNPFADDGDIFKLADLNKGLITRKDLPDNLHYYITCDPAASEKESSDFWAALVWAVDHDDNVYCVDQYHHRGADATQKYLDGVFALCKKYKPMKVFMERCHATNVLAPIIEKRKRERKEYYTFEYPSPGNKDKVARSRSIEARIRQGKVFWLDTPFVMQTVFPELVKFPDGKNDDLVDCASMFGNACDTLISAPPPPLPDPDPFGPDTWSGIMSRRGFGESGRRSGYQRLPDSF